MPAKNTQSAINLKRQAAIDAALREAQEWEAVYRDCGVALEIVAEKPDAWYTEWIYAQAGGYYPRDDARAVFESTREQALKMAQAYRDKASASPKPQRALF